MNVDLAAHSFTGWFDCDIAVIQRLASLWLEALLHEVQSVLPIGNLLVI